MERLRVRAGALLLHRIGPVKPAEQSMWDRAPAPRGLWAFPYPFFEMFFAYHQLERHLPRRLQYLPGTCWPATSYGWVHVDGRTALPHGVLSGRQLQELGFVVSQEWGAQRRAWIAANARALAPRKTFWHAGPVYSHITRDGTVLDLDSWVVMDVTDFARAVQRCGAQTYFDRRDDGSVQRLPRGHSADHLEVFLTRPISSRR